MSAYPLMLDGGSLRAVVVGGGTVAARKVRALLDAGARVSVVSPAVAPEIRDWASAGEALDVRTEPYAAHQLGDAILVIAATNDDVVNATVASDARAAGKLVNVVSDPELGNCTAPAVHRAGDLVIAVSAGGVPPAAIRVRDAVAARIDARYGRAVKDLAALRRALLDEGRRERWHEAAAVLAGPEFCRDVEDGRLDARVAEWR